MKKILLIIVFVLCSIYAQSDNDKNTKFKVDISKSGDMNISFTTSNAENIKIINSHSEVIVDESNSISETFRVSLPSTGTYFIRVQYKDEVIIERIIYQE